MLKVLYSRIIGKLHLSTDELAELRDKLQPSNICSFQFFTDGKMCPNTIALAIKERKDKFSGKREVKDLLKRRGVTKLELGIFLFLYDLPAAVSKKFFEKSLRSMRSIVDQMIVES